MKRPLITALLCVCGLITVKSGQAQNIQAPPRDPIVLEDARPIRDPVTAVYALRCLPIGDTKPTKYIWVLQEQTAPKNGRMEHDIAAFQSLSSPALRSYISRLPPDSRITYSGSLISSHDPAVSTRSASETGLQDLITFCRSKKVEFVLGISF